MTGIGTLVNVCAIILGGFLGLLFKGGLKQHYQDAVLRCLGLCTLFIGAAGGLSGLCPSPAPAWSPAAPWG